MTKAINKPSQHYQAGATLAEAVYILPLFFIIIFSMVEMTFVYKAKATLNLATAEAARKGALNNAQSDSIETALSEGMAPLYALNPNCGAIGLKGTVAAAGYNCARIIQTSIEVVGGQKPVTILSPSKEIFDAFKTKLKVSVRGSSQDKNWVIPNDNLNWRSPATKTLLIGQKNLPINIQDANLLKIKTYWCHKISVPGLDRIAYNTVLRLSTSPEQRYCNRLSQNHTATSVSKALFGKDRGYYVAIRSHAIARMQSPVTGDSLLTSDEIDDVINPTTPTDPEDPIDPTDPNDPTDPIDDPIGPIDPTCDPNEQTCEPPDEECDFITPSGQCIHYCRDGETTGCMCPIPGAPHPTIPPNSSPIPRVPPITGT